MENNLLIIGVVFIPLAGAVLSLFARANNQAQRYIGFGAAALSWLWSLFLLVDVVDNGPQIYRLGDWQPPFGIVLVADSFSALFTVMASTVMMSGLLYAVNCRDKVVKNESFTALFLSMMVGLNGTFLTGDLFTMFVFIELLVIASVSLVAISDNRLGLEAAIKYIFISGIGTVFLLLGIASIYATFGTLNMADIAQQLSTGERPLLARAAAILLMAAFLLKSAVFPFHYWQPDFHTTAPTPVHAVLSSVVVKIGVYGIIRMTTLLFVEEAAQIRQWITILGVISIYFGSLGAFRTYDGKRMLAYSTFGQIGFILVAIGWGTPLAMVAAIVYAVNHAFIKSALLMLMGVVSSNTKEKTATLEKIVGVGTKIRYAWAVSLLWLLGGLALAGLPPMNGFISKLLLVRSGTEAEDWLVLGLVIAAGLITIMYMLRSWQTVFQTKPETFQVEFKKEGGDGILAPSFLIAICLGLGIYATPLFERAEATVEEITTPQIYIESVLPPELLLNPVADAPQEVQR
ncbi:MAG: hypothetical protein HC915_04950 [Anaerolineae bacterium]|nr:hypothetical protein [Anaerolineae bacterium]